MLQKTYGIVLRSIKYGDTSLVCTIFTAVCGVQTYMVQGVRSAKTKNNRAAFFQSGTLLELVVYQRPQRNMQRLREFQPAHIYTTMQEEIVKNSIVLFSAELLLRLLPEQAPMPELFDFTYDYFVQLDKMPVSAVANFPLYFIIQCSRYLGYDIKGSYSEDTPHLNLHEGGFTRQAPTLTPFVNDEDAKILSQVLQLNDFNELKEVNMNATIRFRLLDWYMAFLQQHTEHVINLKSLGVLQAILH